MGFFNRRAAPADANAPAATHEKKSGIFGRRNDAAAHTHNGTPAAWNRRPTFGEWAKATALDIVTMAVMGAIGLGVYFAKPAPSRSFPSKFSIAFAIF